MVKPLLFLIILGGVMGYIFFADTLVSNNHRQDIIVNGPSTIELKTQISISSVERSVGLSNHTSLDDDQAMLFIFDNPGKQSFWMKDMSFPIDIFWLNKEKEIVFIKESAHPDDYPFTYKPTLPASYVLETVAGFAEKYELQNGDSFSWK